VKRRSFKPEYPIFGFLLLKEKGWDEVFRAGKITIFKT